MEILKLLVLPLIISGAIIIAARLLAPKPPVPSPGQMNISATGVSYQVPEHATISAGVVTEALTAQEAMKENSAKMSAILGALKAAGVEERHIQTSQLALSPQYGYRDDNNVRLIKAYEARNTVSARSSDLTKVGQVIDAFIANGANNIEGVEFGITNSQAAKSEARTMAVKEARRKAEEMAGAAGAKLGRILSMNENTHSYGMAQAQMANVMHNMDVGGGESSDTISSGEQRISVTVNISFEVIQ
ncbi:MAG: SIMPL domain-containing protein [Maricaulaceae bacterium]